MPTETETDETAALHDDSVDASNASTEAGSAEAPSAANAPRTPEPTEPTEPSLGITTPGLHAWTTRAAKNLGFTIALLVVLALGVAVGRMGRAAPHEAPNLAEHEHATEVWTCSMHPQIRMDEAGQCPICGMDLVPAESSEAKAAPDAGVVVLTPRAQALAGIRTTEVVRTEPRAEVRLLGRVDYDETRLRMVTPWTDGRIDKLRVRVTGSKVRKGQVVADLYSPELYAAMRDLLVAVKQADKLSDGLHGSGKLAATAVASAREKLRLLGVSDKEITAIERAGAAPKKVSVRSPFSGTVLKRNVEEGDYVKAGTALYHVADLSKVWVQIDAYESDLPHLARGNSVTIELDALPGETFTGEVAFIDPVVDRRTRTARVRVEVPNPKGELRPGMFAQAVVQADIADQSSHLVIPSGAVLFTGRRSVVYVETPGQPGSYALREVRVGAPAGPVFAVLSGLSEGERVVSKGAFVVDADLQLRGGASMMTRPGDDDDATDAPPLTPESLALLGPVVEAYADAQEQLARDDFKSARASLSTLAELANTTKIAEARETREAWQTLASELAGHGRHSAKAQGDADVRRSFERLSDTVAALLTTFGNPTEAPLHIAYCPMAFDNEGAQWVQRTDSPANPYYGSAMLRCGNVRATLAPGERLAATPRDANVERPHTPASSGHNH